jgi:phosphohistidine phosphatase
MQRRLILMRHAKSSWKFPELDDHARPLNKRGRRSAPQVAAALAERGWVPELVVSSDSARTRETWAGMAPALGEPEVVFTERLYHEGLEALIEEAAGWPPEVACVLALGHNPCWEDALAALCGEAERMTTANAALLVGEGEDWPLALGGRWALEALIRPREL